MAILSKANVIFDTLTPFHDLIEVIYNSVEV